MAFELDLDLNGRTNQESRIYGDSNSKITYISKQEKGTKYYYRLMPFNQETMNEIGITLPVFGVKKYMFDSAVDFTDDKKTKPKKVVSVSESVLGGDDLFADHVKMRLTQMKESGDTDGISKHNALFTGKYSRESVSVDNPIQPYEFGIMESWVAALPVEVSLKDGKSIPTVKEAVILNIKSSGKAAIFGRKGKKPVTGMVSELGNALYNQTQGYDICVTKNDNEYHFIFRLEKSDIENDALYLDENLPNAVEEVKSRIDSEEAIRQYDLAIGFTPDEAGEEGEAEVAPETTTKKGKGLVPDIT